MNKKGPIILIEDDLEDQELILSAITELQVSNKIICFTTGEKALEYLKKSTVEPFLILSDIVMLHIDGLQLRDTIDVNQVFKFQFVPYLFFTTYCEEKYVEQVYEKSVQGYFVKPYTYQKLKKVLKTIIAYWCLAEAPQDGKYY